MHQDVVIQKNHEDYKVKKNQYPEPRNNHMHISQALLLGRRLYCINMSEYDDISGT